MRASFGAASTALNRASRALPKALPRALLLALVAVLGFAGCGNKDGGTAVATGRNGRANGLPAGQGGQVQLYGQVFGDDQDRFQYAVQGLVSAQMDEFALGQVSAQATGGTGVFFGGQVMLQGSGGAASVAQGSYLVIGIYDSLVGQPDPGTGQIATPIQIVLTQASGQVSGANATLRFNDGVGSVTLNGVINGQTFSGTLSYENSRNVNGGPGAAAYPMGYFQVPTCQFFLCNQ